MSGSTWATVGRPTLRQRMEGGPLLGMILQVPHPQVAELVGSRGFDFLVVDLEHGSITFDVMENMVRAAEVAGAAPIVRVPNGSVEAVTKAVDAGAAGLMFPMVRSAAEVEACVAAAKLPPLGQRGYCSETRSGRYFQADHEEYSSTTDDLVVVVMIETAAALAEVDAICAVPGVDIVTVGAGDLAADLGVAMVSPETAAAVATVQTSASDRGVRLMKTVFTAEDAAAERSAGTALVNLGVDTIIIGRLCAEVVERWSASAPPSRPSSP